jgi:hypothetical protein
VRDDDHQFKDKQYRNKGINIETLRPALSATLSQQTENRVMDGGHDEKVDQDREVVKRYEVISRLHRGKVGSYSTIITKE